VIILSHKYAENVWSPPRAGVHPTRGAGENGPCYTLKQPLWTSAFVAHLEELTWDLLDQATDAVLGNEVRPQDGTLDPTAANDTRHRDSASGILASAEVIFCTS
jgi:hypothetical protein